MLEEKGIICVTVVPKTCLEVLRKTVTELVMIVICELSFRSRT